MNLLEESAVAFPAFPFEPYPIQLQFMRAVYSGIQKGGVTIVESPTGTGKTLSLICSTLQWLLDQHEHSTSSVVVEAKLGNSVEEESDWMSNFESKKEEEKKEQREVRKRMLKARLAQNSLEKTNGNGSVMNFGGGKTSKDGKKCREQVQQKTSFTVFDDDDDLIVEEYCSDDEAGKQAKRKLPSADSSSSDDDGGESSDDEEPLKVFFCSRTHSQLSQFVAELQRTVFSSSLRSVTLGSRKNLCINPGISRCGIGQFC